MYGIKLFCVFPDGIFGRSPWVTTGEIDGKITGRISRRNIRNFLGVILMQKKKMKWNAEWFFGRNHGKKNFKHVTRNC